jgi:hypothetical protein
MVDRARTTRSSLSVLLPSTMKGKRSAIDGAAWSLVTHDVVS